MSSGAPPSRSRSGRLAQRRGSSAEAALQAETARLGVPNGVLKRGFLVKKGHLVPTRKERYFVLGQHSLSYYKPTKSGDVELKGVLELKASDVISPLSHSDAWLRIRQNEGPGGKSYKLDLKASSLQDRREWIEALRKACRGELLLRQRAIQSDVRLLHVRSSRRGHNAKAMAELLSSPMSIDDASTPRVDLRASFQIFHEMVLLKKLVDTIKSSWGPPSHWSMEQYQELVQGISLAQEKSGSSEFEPDSILAEAFKLRYQFEEIPENQRKLSRDEDPLGASRTSTAEQLKQAELDSPVATPRMSPRIRCPSFHSYYSTFEDLSDRAAEGVKVTANDKQDSGLIRTLTPRSATLAKYAHLYLSDDIRTKQPWSLNRGDNDDLTEQKSGTAVRTTEEAVISALVKRFDDDRIYTYINHHTMVVMNPYRLLQTARFTSIYDEQVVITYSDTPNAELSLAPHPFAIAKQSLVRLFFGREYTMGDSSLLSTTSSKRTASVQRGQSLFLCGESGSGKTELAKDLLKYLVLVAQPTLSRDSGENCPTRTPKVKLFTSSTKSTIQMRTEEARTIALLEAKGVEKYEIVLLDLHPERWDEMTSVSRSKRLPQVHVDGLFFGFYDKLEHLEDEEQLRMYFKNPHAAKKLSTVLDSNIILEAFGHATTSMNLNSSRYGKITTLQVSFGLHPWEFQIRGCHVSPFLLEKSRVTSDRGHQGGDQYDMNFHVLYAMVAGVNAFPFMHLLAKELRLDGIDCSTFCYLGRSDHKLAEFMSKEDTWKKDVERWQQVIDGLDELNVSPDQQKIIFRVLSAVLWLGNIELDYNATSGKLLMSSTGVSNAPQRVVELLELGSVVQLEKMLMTKTVSLLSTNETFEVTLEKGQVNHVRDTLARLLYQLAFEYVVTVMNEATKLSTYGMKDEFLGDSDTMRPPDVSLLKIVDVFGFENLTRNSLDQLCINYLSEKLYAREEQVILAAYSNQASPSSRQVLDKDKDVLFIYEHPLGVFSSLNELTVLHQSENENTQQEEKRNKLFVRNIYERNPSRLPDPPRVLHKGKSQSTISMNALPFVIPHTSGNVVYDANDFVKKNSDFVYSNLLAGLKASTNSIFRRMVDESNELGGTTNKNGNTLDSGESRLPGRKSFVGQFRSHVNALTSQDDKNMPFYFHCIRPNDKKQPSVVSSGLVEQQCRSQRLIRHVEICRDPSLSYSAMDISKSVVLARYGSLLKEPYDLNKVTDDGSLLKWLNGLLGNDDCTPSVRVSATSMIQFKSISLVEKLELLLENREAEAATRIQSLFLMIMWRHRYLSKKRERRGLSNELLAWYGLEKKDTVKKLLEKYNGREDELRSKFELKKKAKLQDEKTMHQLASDIHALCLGTHGGLDSQAVNDILNDDTMRELLQHNEKIVLALRDMSLNPDILVSQLADYELRGFYQKLIDFLRSKKKAVGKASTTSRTVDDQPKGPLDDRVLAAASDENRALWMHLVESEEWAAYHDALVEVGEDPEMLLFHSEDNDFRATLERFLDTLVLEKQREEEQRALAAITNLVQPSTLDEEEVLEVHDSAGVSDEDAEMLELLMSVQFGPSLMTAMNQDSYFVQALQDPILMTSMHQLMANPKNFAISATLQHPAVREFFLKLIALSFAVQKQSDVE